MISSQIKKSLLFIFAVWGGITLCHARPVGWWYSSVYYIGYSQALNAKVSSVNPDSANITLLNKVRFFSRQLPVVAILPEAFQNMYKLKKVDMRPIKQLSAIGERAFYNCYKLDSVFIPDPSNDENAGHLTEIPICCFLDCWSLKYVNLPVKLNIICDRAFHRCKSLQHIDIPYTVEEVRKYAFADCGSLESIVLSTGINYVGEGVFQNCTKLETAEFYNRYPISIRACTFENCVNLKKVCFNKDNIVRIDSFAFKGCSSLKTFTISPTLTQGIGTSAFEGCTSLDSVTTLAEVPPTLGKDAFKDISPTCVLTVPYGTKAAYIAAGWTEDIFKGGIREVIPAGIGSVKVQQRQGEWYDLQGRPTSHPQKGGIYIQNGRKILVK